MAKSRDAFRTISEVAEWLDTPAHVLRFWESKFSQVKPVKRAGGRRYYRPADMLLLAGLKQLLHEDGLTIKGVQKVLREKGVKHVASLADMPVDDDDTIDGEDMAGTGESAAAELHKDAPDLPASDDEGTVVPFASPGAVDAISGNGVEDMSSDMDGGQQSETETAVQSHEEQAAPPAEAVADDAGTTTEDTALASEQLSTPERSEEIPDALSPAALGTPDAEPGGDNTDAGKDQSSEIVDETVEGLPDFITGGAPQHSERSSTQDAAPVPLGADIPPDPADDDISAAPGPISRMAEIDRLTPELAAQLAPFLEQLRELGAARGR